MAQQPLVSRDLLIIEASRSNSTPLPFADTSHNSQRIDIHVPAGIQARNSNKRAAENPHPKDSSHRDRPNVTWLQKHDHSSTWVPNYVYELQTVVTIRVKMALPFHARSAICYQLLLARSTRRSRMNN